MSTEPANVRPLPTGASRVERMAPTAPEHVEDLDTVEQWEPPIPIAGTDEVPTFPLNALPETVRPYVESVAESLGMDDPAMPGAFALPVFASLTAGRWVARCEPLDWSEPLQIHATVVAPPSTGKSPALHAMSEPLDELEKELRETFRPDYERRASEYRIEEQKLRDYERAAAKGDDPNAARNAEDRAEWLADNPLPTEPRLITTNGTPEVLAVMMRDNGGRIAWIDDEPGLFGMMAGRYSKPGAGADLDVFLKGYSGNRPIKTDRIGRESVVVDRPTLTIGIAAQPAAVVEAGRTADAGRGVLARFLWFVPRLDVWDRSVTRARIPDHLRDKYTETLRRLYAVSSSIEPATPRTVTVTLPAWELFRPWLAETAELRRGGSPGLLLEWLGKLDGQTLRIAGNLALMRDPEADEITDRDMSGAITLARYCHAHAVRLFGEVGLSDSLRLAFRCLDHLRRAQHGTAWERLDRGQVSAREVNRALGSAVNADEVRQALHELEGLGYLREIPDSRQGRGARVKGLYEVSPYVLNPSTPTPVENLF